MLVMSGICGKRHCTFASRAQEDHVHCLLVASARLGLALSPLLANDSSTIFSSLLSSLSLQCNVNRYSKCMSISVRECHYLKNTIYEYMYTCRWYIHVHGKIILKIMPIKKKTIFTKRVLLSTSIASISTYVQWMNVFHH